MINVYVMGKMLAAFNETSWQLNSSKMIDISFPGICSFPSALASHFFNVCIFTEKLFTGINKILDLLKVSKANFNILITQYLNADISREQKHSSNFQRVNTGCKHLAPVEAIIILK